MSSRGPEKRHSQPSLHLQNIFNSKILNAMLSLKQAIKAVIACYRA